MNRLCAVCRREDRGLRFDPMLALLNGPVQWACSTKHLHIIAKARQEHIVIDPTPNEKTAAMSGLAAMWQYLKSIGQTDLDLLASDQAAQASICFAGAYHEKLAELTEEIPF